MCQGAPAEAEIIVHGCNLQGLEAGHPAKAQKQALKSAARVPPRTGAPRSLACEALGQDQLSEGGHCDQLLSQLQTFLQDPSFKIWLLFS